MLSGYYDSSLLLISILVAIMASYTALMLGARVRQSQGPIAYAWTGGGAVAMGTGIWAMHFIGMLAFRLPLPMGYDAGITLLSWLLPVVVSALALWQLRDAAASTWRVMSSAVLMGLGINTMHYTGMAALRMDPGIVYALLPFVASVMIAIGASGGALWIAFRLRERVRHPGLVRMGAAIVMGAAIAGMHYTGMAAANFPLGSVCLAAGTGMGQNNLAVLVTVATVAVLAIALLAAAYDARLAARAHILAASQAIAEERRALYLQEQAARLEAERVSALKDEFLATLSHELRTPLNAVMGWSQLLMQGRCDASTRQRGLETIERNARAQARLIEDLLDMSKIISGKMQLEKGPVWPGEFVALAVDSVRPAALARKIRIDTQLDERLDPRVDPSAGPLQGDAGRLQQVMLNLLSNAVKFTPPGGQVRVSLLREAGAVAIQVADTGIGIAPEFLPFVFDRFRQADASTTRRHGGLGLGLSIASQLAQMQGGSLVADSAGHGHGAAFTLRLPLPLATVVA